MTFLETIASGAGKRLLIGGHRGHLSEVRENTLENFAQILGSGVDYIEIDVQLTADGQAVIYHDRPWTALSSVRQGPGLYRGTAEGGFCAEYAG